MLLNEKKEVFRSGDSEAVKEVQRCFSVKLKEERDNYKKKLEQKLQQNNSRDTWRDMKAITGSSSQGTDGGVKRPNELLMCFFFF